MAAEPVKVDITYTDERRITLRRLNEKESSAEFVRLLLSASHDGYVISNASEIRGGDQRDPYTIGLQVVLKRTEPPRPTVFREAPGLTPPRSHDYGC